MTMMAKSGLLFEVALSVISFVSLCVCVYRVLLVSLDLLAELDPLALL